MLNSESVDLLVRLMLALQWLVLEMCDPGNLPL